MNRKEVLTNLSAVERYLYYLARKCTGDDAETLTQWARAVNNARAAMIADMVMEDDGR